MWNLWPSRQKRSAPRSDTGPRRLLLRDLFLITEMRFLKTRTLESSPPSLTTKNPTFQSSWRSGVYTAQESKGHSGLRHTHWPQVRQWAITTIIGWDWNESALWRDLSNSINLGRFQDGRTQTVSRHLSYLMVCLSVVIMTAHCWTFGVAQRWRQAVGEGSLSARCFLVLSPT